MNFLMNGLMIASHVPLWAWLVLAYGLWMGFSAMRIRKVSLWMATLMPLVFWGLSLSTIVGIVGEAPAVALVWLLAVGAGVAVGWYYLSSEPLEVHRGKASLVLPGTWTSLVLFLTIFVTKFVYGYEQVADPALAGNMIFLLVVFGLSGLSTGIVTGRTARLYSHYYQNPAPEKV